MLRTYQPKKLHRKKEHGFRKRMATKNGRKVLARRRAKGKNVTLKENRDFLRLYRKGKCYVSSSLVTYVLKNRSNEKRYGITTSKKIGKAVQRNRARRVIRASLYDLYSDIIPGYDIVFVARGKTPYVKSDVVKKEMTDHLKKAKVLRTA